MPSSGLLVLVATCCVQAGASHLRPLGAPRVPAGRRPPGGIDLLRGGGCTGRLCNRTELTGMKVGSAMAQVRAAADPEVRDGADPAKEAEAHEEGGEEEAKADPANEAEAHGEDGEEEAKAREEDGEDTAEEHPKDVADGAHSGRDSTKEPDAIDEEGSVKKLSASDAGSKTGSLPAVFSDTPLLPHIGLRISEVIGKVEDAYRGRIETIKEVRGRLRQHRERLQQVREEESKEVGGIIGNIIGGSPIGVTDVQSRHVDTGVHIHNIIGAEAKRLDIIGDAISEVYQGFSHSARPAADRVHPDKCCCYGIARNYCYMMPGADFGAACPRVTWAKEGPRDVACPHFAQLQGGIDIDPAADASDNSRCKQKWVMEDVCPAPSKCCCYTAGRDWCYKIPFEEYHTCPRLTQWIYNTDPCFGGNGVDPHDPGAQSPMPKCDSLGNKAQPAPGSLWSSTATSPVFVQNPKCPLLNRRQPEEDKKYRCCCYGIAKEYCYNFDIQAHRLGAEGFPDACPTVRWEKRGGWVVCPGGDVTGTQSFLALSCSDRYHQQEAWCGLEEPTPSREGTAANPKHVKLPGISPFQNPKHQKESQPTGPKPPKLPGAGVPGPVMEPVKLPFPRSAKQPGAGIPGTVSQSGAGIPLATIQSGGFW